MNDEPYRGSNPDEPLPFPEMIKREAFYKAYKYLQDHPIFDTTPGEILDLSEIEDPFEKGSKLGEGLYLYSSQGFENSLRIEVVKVNPKTDEIDENPSRNTKVQIWLEAGPWDTNLLNADQGEEKVGGFTNDYDLSCGGDTFEDAIIKMAELVRTKYDSPPFSPDQLPNG